MGAGQQRGRENGFLSARHSPSQRCPAGRGQWEWGVGVGGLWGNCHSQLAVTTLSHPLPLEREALGRQAWQGCLVLLFS